MVDPTGHVASNSDVVNWYNDRAWESDFAYWNTAYSYWEREAEADSAYINAISTYGERTLSSKEKASSSKTSSASPASKDAKKPKTPNKETSKPVSYVFYDPKNFPNQAKSAAKVLKGKYGGEVKLIPITTAKDFVKQWNSMPANVGGVTLVFHGTPHTINIDADKREYLTTSSDGKTPAGNPATYIGDLADKTIDQLTILSCNAGHLDHMDDNVAMTFLNTNNITNVIASDGNVAFSRRVGIYSYGFGDYIPRLSFSQKSFYAYLVNGSRSPVGFVLFTKD
jgi:hypothetical protein